MYFQTALQVWSTVCFENFSPRNRGPNWKSYFSKRSAVNLHMLLIFIAHGYLHENSNGKLLPANRVSKITPLMVGTGHKICYFNFISHGHLYWFCAESFCGVITIFIIKEIIKKPFSSYYHDHLVGTFQAISKISYGTLISWRWSESTHDLWCQSQAFMGVWRVLQ